ncbi:MAG: response regulator [Chloroflexota bacterium]|jgi:NarL family two-component system response regulator LiaR
MKTQITPKCSKKINIMLVEDQAVVREGIAAIISVQPDMKVIAEAENGLQAVSLAKEHKPDVVILDMVMPKLDGLSTIPKLLEVNPATKILVLTGFAESDRVYQAIRSGALGYMLKDATRSQLIQSLREVASGHASIHPSIAIKVINEFEKKSSESEGLKKSLTKREIETLRYIARGLSNQEIAMALVVHERTVAKYVSSILNKLHVTNRTQAALYAIRVGIAIAPIV